MFRWVYSQSKDRRDETALVLRQFFFKKQVLHNTGVHISAMRTDVTRHQPSNLCQKTRGGFGEYVSGASPAPEILLGASNSRDSRGIGWNRVLTVCAHRESEIS